MCSYEAPRSRSAVPGWPLHLFERRLLSFQAKKRVICTTSPSTVSTDISLVALHFQSCEECRGLCWHHPVARVRVDSCARVAARGAKVLIRPEVCARHDDRQQLSVSARRLSASRLRRGCHHTRSVREDLRITSNRRGLPVNLPHIVAKLVKPASAPVAANSA